MATSLEQLDGKYEILEKLREDDTGATYRVRHRLSGEMRVVEVAQPHPQGDPGERDRFDGAVERQPTSGETETRILKPAGSPPASDGTAKRQPSSVTAQTRILRPTEGHSAEGRPVEGRLAGIAPAGAPVPGDETVTVIHVPPASDGSESATRRIDRSEPAPAAEPAALEETLRTIRALRDEGQAGEALQRLNGAVREFGPRRRLQTLRYELGEALLERDAKDEDTARRMFEAAMPADPATTTVMSAPPPAGTPAARAPAARAPVIADTPIRGLSDATIRSTEVPSAATSGRPGPPTAHPTRNMVAIGVVLVAVFAALVFFLKRSERAAVERRAPETQDVAAAALSPGSLAIDAVPWAEIVHLENPAAEDQPAISPSRFTPVILRLPPGEYRITLRCPPTGQEEEKVVLVESDRRADLRVSFENLDAEQYFQRIGW